MKRMLMLCCSMIVWLHTHAQTNIVVFSANSERFWLVINGIRQNARPSQNVKVTDLQGTAWKLKVVFENQTLGELSANAFAHEGPAEITYQIRPNSKGKSVIRLFSVNPITPVTTTRPAPDTQPTEPNQDVIPFRLEAPGIKIEMNYPPGAIAPIQEPTQDPVRVSSAQNCLTAIGDFEFEGIEQTIAAQPFEETKITVAKQIITTHCLNTAQVKTILGLFSFEESKLDFAKAAYERVTNPRQYYQLNDAFDMSSSVEELSRYVRSRPR